QEASHPHPLIPRQTLLGELYARLSRALILPVLPLLAMPLGLTAKRGGRAPGIIVAGLMLLIFQYLIDFGQGLASTGRAYALPAVGAPFFTFTAISLMMFMSGRKRPGQTPLGVAIEWVNEQLARLRRRRAGDPP